MEPLFIIVVLVVAFLLFIYLPMKMAEARGRSALGWVCISLFFSPIVAIVGLLVLGDTYEEAKRKNLSGRFQ